MIKANELRIGNLVVKSDQIHSDSPQYGQITTVYVDKANVDYHYPLTWYKPIPLTEEWLLKFGFEKKLDKFSLKNKKSGVFRFAKISSGIIVGELEHGRYSISEFIKYVHQLQNLYFALTGEELKLQE